MPQNFIESRRKHGCACWRVETSTCSAATPAASLDQVHRPGAQAAARWPGSGGRRDVAVESQRLLFGGVDKLSR
jgi:hypothetical protein